MSLGGLGGLGSLSMLMPWSFNRHATPSRIVREIEHHEPLDIEEGEYGDMLIKKHTFKDGVSLDYEPNGGRAEKHQPKVRIRGPVTITYLQQRLKDGEKRPQPSADDDCKLWMSDTPQEYVTNRQEITRVRGHVLVGGLGLGLVLKQMHESKRRITQVTVVDLSENLIQLIGPQLTDGRFRFPLELVRGDIRDTSTWKTWNPKTRKFKAGAYPVYDTAYLDIWPTLIGKIVVLWPDIIPVFGLVKGAIGLWGETALRKRLKDAFPRFRGYWASDTTRGAFYDMLLDFADERDIGRGKHKSLGDGKTRTTYDGDEICKAWWDAVFRKREVDPCPVAVST